MGPPVSAVDPVARAEELRRLITYHNDRYHRLDEPEITDGEFDVARCRSYEPSRPITPIWPYRCRPPQPSAPHRRPSSLRSTHRVPMMSLDNAFSARGAAGLGRPSGQTDPAQATALRLRAQDRRPGHVADLRRRRASSQAATRGDGTTGEDVTANVATIAAIPHRLSWPAGGPPPESSRSAARSTCPRAFDELNRRQAEAGREALRQPAQSAAGSLRQKDPSITAIRSLVLLGLPGRRPVGRRPGTPPATSTPSSCLASAGFPVNPEIERS